MTRVFSLFFLAGFALGGAQAQGPVCEQSEPSCVLEAAWGASLVLSPEKIDRLRPALLEVAYLAGDPDLLSFWENRLERSYSAAPVHSDYGWQMAEPILRAGGVDDLIDMANRRAEPLNFGRSDALLSAGRRLYSTDPDGARQLNRALLSLSKSASQFERPVLAHAAAELAMVRCDGAMFDAAMAQATAPENLRYAFWRARLDGDASDLLPRVRALDTGEDTRDVRRVLDGYRAILELGYCPAPKQPIGG